MKVLMPMLRNFLPIFFVLPSWSSAMEASGPDLADISNFRQYNSLFASSGQPTREQYQSLADHGFERVVFLAFNSSNGALPDADQLIKNLGMEYMHVPVDFNNPLPDDFYTFADSMQHNTSKKTLLHCVVNFRASAFSFLYRVIYEGIPIAEAKADMNSVWQPNEVWRDYIFSIMAEHDLSPVCEACDWSVETEQNQ
jgi:protein tyrosine phosphatase (PTP) superfamily phosphohydrolase (DUF442 family)